MKSERRACLALSLLTEPGDPRLVPLLGEHGPVALLSALMSGRRRIAALPPAWTERAQAAEQLVEAALARAEETGLRWLARTDAGWPSQLDDLDHLEPLNASTGSPLGLWLRGNGSLAALSDNSVAIVGARDATTYGAEVAGELAADVSDAGLVVVSGAAYGIDGCAHRGALSLDKPTIAVLAGGADVDYPRSHTALLARIAADGLVASEQAPGTAPLKARFLSRNRIIAALSGGTVVVEAARRSGSLNTLNWADQLGRITMGVPGPVTSRASVGVHEALRTGKAVLVTNGADVLEALGGFGAPESTPGRAAETAFDHLSHDERRVLDAVPWSPPRALGAIAGEVRLSTATVRTHLIRLQQAGYVAQLPAGWSLLRRADLV